MASRHDIIHIDFQASAGRANSAIKSIQASADEAAAKVKNLREKLAEAEEMGDKGKIKDLKKQVADADKQSKEWKKAVLDLTKGVTALDEAIKLFNKGKGSVESMSVALAKTARNAAELQQSRIKDHGSKDWKELDALVHALDITITRGKSDLDGLIATIQSGGSASKLVLEQAMKDLEALRNSEEKGTKEWKQFDAELQTVIGHVSELNKKELQAKAGILNGKNLGQYDETKIRAAIDATKELMNTVATGSTEYNQYAQNIVNAEKHLDQYGLAAVRAAEREAEAKAKQEAAEKQLQTTMNQRLTTLKTISADALTETKRYWQAQRDGAEQGSKAFKDAESALKRITGQERQRKTAQLDSILQSPSKFGISEVQNAVKEMERLRDSVQKGIPQWQHYNKMVEQGKTYLDNLAKTEAAQRIEKQMQNLNTISEKGLAEVKKYWETMVAGAERGSTELATYEANLKRVTEEEKARSIEAAKQKVSILSSANLGNYSENEIRAAIAAGNQLIKTYGTASSEAKKLGQDIVSAEEHLKQYGTEAARTALKEKKALEEVERKRKESDQKMQQQLAKGTALSQQALKEQERYWQKLIDDPKTAAASLQQYQANLAQVKAIQEQMVAEAGKNALAFFRGDTSNASAAQIQEQAKALKTYRDSLPRESEAAVIEEINGYLVQSGIAAGEAAAKMMSLEEAEKLAASAGTNGFRGTTQQLKQARDVIIEAMSSTEKGTERYNQLAEALRRVELEMQNTGKLTEEVNNIINEPKGRSMNELADAIKRADLAMRSMDTTSNEYKQLAEKIKICKEELKNLELQSRNTVGAFEKAWNRFKTFVGVYVSGAVALQKIVATFEKANELSDKMGEVGKTTSMTDEQIAHLQESLGRISTRTAMNELMGLSAAAGQLGLKAEQDVLAFTRAANKITVALPEMGREGVTELMKIAKATDTVADMQRQINAGVIEDSNAIEAALTRVGSTIDALRANSASTAPRITDFVKRVGAVGAQANMSIDQIAALGSTVDALGLRVEMSATALSRMIPAIKNNAFGISQAIGIAPEEITRMYEAGDAMQIIVKLLRAMAGKGEDEIEGMLNKGGFADILSELNQQGARAGMVFAGLAQNVNELERQLDIASDAFRENIAIENEYMRMNETSAGKLAQLGNTITNFFVRASSSKFLGGVYDFLNWFLKNWIDNPRFQFFFNSLIGYLVVVKTNLAGIFIGGIIASWKALVTMFEQAGRSIQNLGGALLNVKTGIKEVGAAAKLANVANAWAAVATAVIMAIQAYKAWVAEAHKVEKIASEAMSRVASETAAATAKVDDLFKSIGNARVAVEDARKEVVEAEKALKAAKEAADGSRESTERLEKAEADLKVATEKSTIANDAHHDSIRKLNQEYSPYLGYMLSEISTAKELANARELINLRLEETIRLKQKEAAYVRIEEEMGGKKDDRRKDLYSFIDQNVDDPEKAARLRKDINTAIKQTVKDSEELKKRGLNANQVLYDAINTVFENEGLGRDYRGGYASKLKAIQTYAKDLYKEEKKFADALKRIDDDFNADIKNIRTGTTYTKGTQQELREQLEAIDMGDEGEDNGLRKLEELYKKADDKTRKARAAALLQQMDAYEDLLDNSKNFFDLQEKDEEASYTELIKNGDARMKGLRDQREKLLKEAGDAYKSRDKVDGSSTKANTPASPWGSDPNSNTPYEKWSGDDLVARRKAMLTFVKALQDGTDVQKVLSQDSAFMQAAVRDKIKTTEQAIEWYNDERLKIQKALYDKWLTNEGGWRDPKQGGKSWAKQLKMDFDSYLKMLDAYYTERKAEIQKAQTEEGLSEEEAQRKIVANEQIWRQRRMELQKIYLGKSKEIAKEERDAIYAILAKMDEDTAETVEKTIGVSLQRFKLLYEKDRVAAERVESNYVKGISTDLLKQQNAVSNQLNAIRDIIAKERPYDGITDNLRKNLSTMGILLADFDAKQADAIKAGKEPENDNVQRVREETKRMTFLLRQAEHAYTLTTEEMMRRMAGAGLTAWADELNSNPNGNAMKQALMAQLRNTYDAIQEAIKKEASIVKKQLEIQWNDILPGRDRSIKDQFERMLSQLGLQEDQVKRANSLIGAGPASERVADKLAIQQMRVRLQMQETYFAMMQKIGQERIQQLNASAEANQREAITLKMKAKLLRIEGKEEEAVTTELKAQRAERKALQDALDAEHAQKSLNLAKTKEATELEKQRVAIANKLEESQNRLYKEIKSYVDILTSGLQKVFEASNTGNEEYYNERAKLNLTGESGGAQQYIIIDNAGTEDAEAHYETLSELEYLERKREIDQKNAQADAWKALMDDLAAKMDETITDQINAWFQDQATEANTEALRLNTEALQNSTEAITGNTNSANSSGIVPPTVPDSSEPIIINNNNSGGNTPSVEIGTLIPQGIIPEGGGSEEGGTVGTGALSGQSMFPMTDDEVAKAQANIELLWKTYTEQGASAMIALAEQLGGLENIVLPPWQMPEGGVEGAVERIQQLWEAYAEYGIEAMQEMSDAMGEMENLPPDPTHLTEDGVNNAIENAASLAMGQAQAQMDASQQATETIKDNQKQQQQSGDKTNKDMLKSNESMWAKMTKAMNLYGVAYQAMSNDNLSTEQKFEMIALQTAGNAAMAGLQVAMSEMTSKTTAKLAEAGAEASAQEGPIAGPILFAVLSALIGGLMGLAASKITKAKSDISSVTGASSSASVGKLTTGMLTYAEGNVNEFTDPGSLQTGRSYNVDAADGRTYRARYMGANPKTHITNGPEFHLAGERGREMIIDAGTTKQIVYNEPAVMKAIETLSVGGRLRRISSAPRRGRGVAAFADGNIEDFEEMANEQAAVANGTSINLEALQSSLDRQSDLLEDLRQNGIKAHFDVYGKGGLIDSYDTGKKFVSDRDWPY